MPPVTVKELDVGECLVGPVVTGKNQQTVWGKCPALHTLYGAIQLDRFSISPTTLSVKTVHGIYLIEV